MSNSLRRLAFDLPSLASLCALVLPLTLYVVSLHPGIDFWDTGEMQTVPYILGIAHPTAFPTFVLLGWVFSHLVALGNVAWRVNLMSACAVALGCWLLYKTLREREVDWGSALGAALLFAIGPIVWAHAVRAEVHDLALGFCALVIWLALRWYRLAQPRDLYLCALCGALAVGNHGGAILLLPGVLVIVLARGRALNVRRVAGALGCILAGGLVYVYLPLRSAVVYAQHKDPTVFVLGLPPGRPFWDYDHPSTWSGFFTLVSGREFDVGNGLAAIVSPAGYARLPVYWQALTHEIGTPALVFAGIGVLTLLLRRPVVALGLFLCGFLAVPFVLSYTAESEVERYFMPSFWVAAAFAGVGLNALVRLLDRARGASPAGELRRFAAFLALMGATYGVFSGNPNLAATRNDTADAFIDYALRNTPSSAVLVAYWPYATPLAYAAYVQGRLENRILVTASPDQFANLYSGWLATRPVYIIYEFAMMPLPGVRVTPVGTYLYKVEALGAAR